jgi:5-methylcytosine-specific restriction enzyme subunit McrC
MIKTTDNTNDEKSVSGLSSKTKKLISNHLLITVGDYLTYKNNKVLQLFGQGANELNIDPSEVIIAISKKNDATQYQVQTGNYIGKFFWEGLEIEIGSRFSDPFMKRMLNFANDIFLDDVNINAKSSNSDKLDITRFILYYLFSQSLEKAFLLGLPKSYEVNKHNDLVLKGRIDITAFINKNFPFQGRISSVVSEQRETQEIVNVLHKAVEIVSSSGFSTKNISHVRTHLKALSTKEVVTSAILDNALKSKSLRNPIYMPYKKVLEYAKTIITSNDIQSNRDGKAQFHGFILNVAELFEVYITKLLRKEFKNWMVDSPKIQLYENSFFVRKIIPDIVMRDDTNKVLVFDTKYKRMLMRGKNFYGGDVDREDFFQINTYMSYFNNQNFDVLAGGLIYPMERFDQKACYAASWLGEKNTKFIVDGIDFSKLKNDNFRELENSFVSRLGNIMHRND